MENTFPGKIPVKVISISVVNTNFTFIFCYKVFRWLERDSLAIHWCRNNK